MRDYTIEEAIKIIHDCDESFNPYTKHFNARNIQRIDNSQLIFDTFLYDPLMGIIKQKYNNFRLYFKHRNKQSKDISLVISINDDRTVNFITVMLTDRNKRVR